jgi:hypothetical protein
MTLRKLMIIAACLLTGSPALAAGPTGTPTIVRLSLTFGGWSLRTSLFCGE